MSADRALVWIVSLLLVSAVQAHSGHGAPPDGGQAARYTDEAPADVELELEKLAEERAQAVAAKKPALHLAALDRRKTILDLRHRVAVLRLERHRARGTGKTEEARRLDRLIDDAKRKLQQAAAVTSK